MDNDGLTAKPFHKVFGRIDPRREAPFLVSVLLSRLLVTACLFWAIGVLQAMPLAVFLCLLKTSSALAYLVLQRPFSTGKRITRAMWLRVLRHSLLVSMTCVVWALGLSLCGALRTVLLWEHSDIALTAVVGAIASLGSTKGRGALLFVLGTLSLLFFDNDQSTPPVEHPEGPHRSVVSHTLYWMLSFLGVPDHKGGLVLLLVGLGLTVIQRSSGRRLAVELGGGKRLQALSTLVVAVILLPWALVQLSTQSLSVSWSSALVCLLATSIAQVIDYYTISIATQHLDTPAVSRLSSMASFIFSLIIAYLLWSHTSSDDHGITVGVVIATVLYILATPILAGSMPRSSTSTLIGYSASGLPLYQVKNSPSLLDLIRPGLYKIMDSPDSRRILYFLLLNLAFTFVELLYGMWTNSLGLISDGFHMLFDSTALLVGLYASLMSRWKPTHLFSYGYGRVEILSGFVNGLFLVGIACFVLSEALNRLMEPPNINTDKLLVVSIAGFIVNLIGIATFSFNGSHTHSHGGHTHSHNANMRGVFLHILADLMGSIGVIVSTLLVQSFGWYIADPVCSLFIAILILISVGPLLKQSAEVLLLATPTHSALHTALDKLSLLDGVLTFSDAHFWQHSSDTIAGTLHVQVAPSANEQKVITMVTNYLREQGVSNLTVQVEKEQYSHCNITQSYVRQLGQSTPPQVYVDYGPHTGEIKAI
ncbi:proton-coupled zinc antiporter SLC30A5-like isoform X2 [Halichondria panicea]|uniref:proton-coupled zinc antiporter SLC30A5-like isoform X2 n=1 Tax=Halichondria panicea TaxID=6063 RepID=UPI00312B4A72